MRQFLPLALPMHPTQPRPTSKSPNPLAIKPKDAQRQVIRQQQRAKDARNHNGVPPLQNPVQKLQSHPETDGLFSQVHGDQHLARVGVVRVHGVGEGEGEIEVSPPVYHGYSEHVANPMEVVLCGQAVDYEAGRRNNHGWEEDGEAHFGFANVVVFDGQVGGETVGCECEGDSAEVSYCIRDGDETCVFLGGEKC